MVRLKKVPTFRDSEETQEHDTIGVCSSEAIVYVPNGEIDRPIFIMSCSNRYCRFITTKNDGAKDRAMHFRIFSNNVLNTMHISLRLKGDSRQNPLPVSKPNLRT
jgi:hypothetical protein